MGEPKDILAAAAWLKAQGYERIVCIGDSMGGMACLKAAVESPETFEALAILAAPFPDKDYSNLILPKIFILTEQDYANRNNDNDFDTIYQSLPEPKTLVILPGTAHGAAIFKSPAGEQLTELLTTFLEELR
jgi:pimeloyl-ACP methyl ester carboxylesterase